MFLIFVIASKQVAFPIVNNSKNTRDGPLLNFGDMERISSIQQVSLDEVLQRLCSDGSKTIAFVTSIDGQVTNIGSHHICITDFILSLALMSITGDIWTERTQCMIPLDKTTNLSIKVKTPVQAEKTEYSYKDANDNRVSLNAVMPPIGLSSDIDGLTVEFDFENFALGQEALAYIYKKGIKIPPTKITNTSGYEFRFKSREITNRADYGIHPDDPSAYMLGYFDIIEKQESGKDKSRLKSGEIAGVVIATVVVVGAIIGGVTYAIMRKSVLEDSHEI